jgi:hypothetical protein
VAGKYGKIVEGRLRAHMRRGTRARTNTGTRAESFGEVAWRYKHEGKGERIDDARTLGRKVDKLIAVGGLENSGNR